MHQCIPQTRQYQQALFVPAVERIRDLDQHSDDLIRNAALLGMPSLTIREGGALILVCSLLAGFVTTVVLATIGDQDESESE